jgi:hypothetical protein
MRLRKGYAGRFDFTETDTPGQGRRRWTPAKVRPADSAVRWETSKKIRSSRYAHIKRWISPPLIFQMIEIEHGADALFRQQLR